MGCRPRWILLTCLLTSTLFFIDCCMANDRGGQRLAPVSPASRWSASRIGQAGVDRSAAAAPPESATDVAHHYTHLQRLPAPRILRSAEPYPGGSYVARHLIDGRADTQYASRNKGTETHVDFDFGQQVALAGYQHTDRRDPATINAITLIFSDDARFQNVLRAEPIGHANKPGGVTRRVFRRPIVARYVRWKVTALSAAGHQCVGGADIAFFAPVDRELAPSRDRIVVRATPALMRTDQGPMQAVTVTVDHPYAEPAAATLVFPGAQRIGLPLKFGSQTCTVELPAVPRPLETEVALEVEGQVLLTERFVRRLVRCWELFILPHSHVDIGYTHVQTEVEQRQWDNLREAIEIARRTADYPPGARFKWNSEGLWAVDSFLQRAPPADGQELLAAVRRGWVHLDGLYGNELTGLCRPEELFQLTACARRISKRYDLTIDSAMISDVPGYTWGLVPALTRSGIKYLSVGPNHTHRIGLTLREWGDRPFWWVSPSGENRLLFWMAGKAYSWFHRSRVDRLTADTNPEPFFAYLEELVDKDYPYDMVQIRYSIGGDNGPPDPELPEFVKAWNEKYVHPRMIIATTSEMMRKFEQQYGAQLPEWRGDFTPYWEDGAASTARETALTRMASERLVQAETLWAVLDPAHFPAHGFNRAWRNTILYNEHTWGAHCSITQPDSPFTKSQWEIKRNFARCAHRQSRALLEAVLTPRESRKKQVTAVDVLNTTSWPRTDLVTVASNWPLAGQIVKDAAGQTVPSKVSPCGGLMFVARDVPPLGARRFRIEAGTAPEIGSARAAGHVVQNQAIRVEIDPETGAIRSLRCRGVPGELVAQTDATKGLNQLFYVAGRDPAQRATSHVRRIEADSHGLVSTLVVRSQAPGCRGVLGRIRVIDGIERVDVRNTVDRERVLSPDAIHLAFPFQVPDGTMRLDIPWAVIRPEIDQLPGSCKNYFSVGRWVDVSNSALGVTWATRSAPMVEVGEIRMDVASPLRSDDWLRHLEPTTQLFSYAMNNYWETNYKAAQEGKATFEYALMPHGPYDQPAAMRFGIGRSQPLIVHPVDPDLPVPGSRLRVAPESVIVTSLKPTGDGDALALRLWNVGRRPVQARLAWSEPAPARVVLSDPRERVGRRVSGAMTLPPMGIVTLRAEMPPADR